MIQNVMIGFILSLMIAGLAYRKKSLTLSGMFGALILGTVIYGIGHWIFYVFMMFFFLSSLVIRKIVAKSYPIRHQASMPPPQKHEARSWVQVIANAGFLALISVLYGVFPTDYAIFMAAVSMAAASSDTWASEIGILSQKKPRSLIRHQAMETGLSGGVTALGLWASLAGSGMIALVYGLYYGIRIGFDLELILLIGLCTLGGFLGSLFDSLLGEFFQAKFKTQRNEIVEVSTSPSDILVHGVRWVDNNLVNFLSNVFVVSSFSILILWLGLL